MLVFFAFAIERNPLRGNPNYAVWHLLLKEIPYGEIRWFISFVVLLKDIPYGENQLRRLAFAVEGNPLRGNPMVHFVGGSIERNPLRGKPITPFGICY